MPTVSITDADNGFRTTKLTWQWSGGSPNLTNLKIKYKKKTRCATVFGRDVGVGDCAERSVSSAQNPNLNAGDVEYIFKGIDYSAGAGGLLQDKEYEFRVEAVISGHAQPVESAAYRTTTLPPLTFAPTEVTWVGGHEEDQANLPKAFGAMEWGVLDSGYVQLGNTTWGINSNREDNTDRYAFQFTVPNATGFQGLRVGAAANHHSPCNWTKWAANTPTSKDTSPWMRWSFQRSSAHQPSPPEYKLVRCGIGDGTSRITVNVINTEHGHEWTAFAIPVRHAWHDADEVVDYQLDCANWPAPTLHVNYENAISEGASAWGTDVGVSFGKVIQTGCALFDKSGRVTIELYTFNPNDPNSINPCEEAKAKACVISTESVYPHRVTRQFLIKENEPWVNEKHPVTGAIPSDKRYLPWVVTHELGHTAGLRHSPNIDDVMYGEVKPLGDVRTTPTDNDVSAMKALYESHAAHN